MEIIRSVTGENIIIKTTEILYIFLSMIKQLESLLKKHPEILLYFTDDKTTEIFV